MKIDFLALGASFSFIAAVLHLAIIVGGPNWYRMFGAGEAMANMAEADMLRPAVITACIALVLASWGCYALSGAGILPKFPLLKLGLSLIALVYLARGLLGFCAVFYPDHPAFVENSTNFWVWSSLICLCLGLVHMKGLYDRWAFLGQ